MEPDILIKPITEDPGVEDHIKSENETSSDEEDSELSGDKAIYTCTQTQHKIKKSKLEIQGEMRVANINEPPEWEIGNQIQIWTHTNLLTMTLMGRMGEVISTQLPLAQRKSAHERKLPKKYDDFILGPIKQLNAILENHFLGRVFTANKNSQICV